MESAEENKALVLDDFLYFFWGCDFFCGALNYNYCLFFTAVVS